MGKTLEHEFPETILVGFFKCYIDDCPGKGYYIMENKEDNTRSCDECFHNQELQGKPTEYNINLKTKL
jgi:hypothetical protein